MILQSPILFYCSACKAQLASQVGEILKAEYCEQIKAFHNSPQYQHYLSNAASRQKKGGSNSASGGGEPRHSIGGSSNALMSSNIINTLNSNNRSAGVSNDLNGMSHYAIEPAEDDGIDDSLSMRQVALGR